MTKILVPTLTIAVVLVGSYFGLKQITKNIGRTPPPSGISTPALSPTSQELKTFQSKMMKFSIATPTEFDSVENLGRVTI